MKPRVAISCPRKSRLLWASLAAATFLVACGGGEGGASFFPFPSNPNVPVASNPGSSNTAPPPVVEPDFSPTYVSDSLNYDGSASGSLKKSEAIEQSAQSQHEVTVDGQRLKYVATVGHLNVSDVTLDEEPTARMFYAAYTLSAKDAQRPITFFYNGGPGSSSAWLHMGSFAPRRLDVNAPHYYTEANADGTPPQFQLVDNKESLLATTDLVFVDAIATGFSQAIEPKTNLDFWNTDADAAAFRDFIVRYLSATKRTGAPIYLAGESYGGPRTAILSRLLAERGIAPQGIILISPILNYNSNCSKDTSTSGSKYISCLGFIPTYVAMTAYFQPEIIPAGRTLADFLEQEVVPYARTVYGPDLKKYMDARKKYNSTTGADKTAAGLELEAATSAMETIRANMLSKYRFEIVRAKGMPYNPKPVRIYEVGGTFVDKELGRYDSRIAVPAGSKWSIEGDPASTLLYASYTSNINELLKTQLNFSASTSYRLKTEDTWTFSHQINGSPAVTSPPINEVDTIPDIQAALKIHPKMKIFAASGYSDMATPFYQTLLDLQRLSADESKNLVIKNYEGGHMMYLTDASRMRLKSDLDAFYRAQPAH